MLLGGELPCRSASPCPAHAQSPSLQSKSCSVPMWKELVPRLVLCLGLDVCSAPAVPGGFSFPEEHWCNMTYGNVKRYSGCSVNLRIIFGLGRNKRSPILCYKLTGRKDVWRCLLLWQS